MKIKVNLNEIKDNPIEYGTKIQIPILIGLLRKANDLYYNSDKSLFSDETYDILKDILEERKPDATILNQVGTEILDNDKEVLPFHMGSMNKVKKASGIKLWMQEYFNRNDKVVISDKMDGVSGLLVMENGINTLYSRGDSKFGRNISPMIENMNIPKLNGKFVIRGEIIMSKDKFDKYNKEYSEARSLVNGICRTAGLNNHKNLNVDRCRDVDFVAYEVIEPKLTPINQFKLMKKMGFIIPNITTADFDTFNNFGNDNMEESFLGNTLINHRANSNYDIDGIIITVNKDYDRNTDGNPKYSFAFKMNGVGIETEVTDVEWNISKHGQIIPKVRFNPIKIGGIKVEKTTGFHGKYIKTNKIGPGCIIKVIRSGDVIPYISEVVKSADYPKMPEIDYIWTESGVNILVKDKKDNNELELKKLVAFFRHLGIENMNVGIITKLYEHHYNSINKILEITVDQLLTIPGVKKTLAEKLYNSIHKIIDKPIPISTVMSSSLIFGHGFGSRRFEMILNKYPTILEFQKVTLSMITAVEGFQEKTAKKFISNLEEFHQFLEDTPSINLLPFSNTKNTKGDTFKNHKIVFTDFRDDNLEELVVDYGGTIAKSLSGKTTMLIVKDNTTNNSKTEKANKINIPILTKEQFLSKYGIEI